MSNYVQNRSGTFYFRRIVPVELRALFGGKREWTYSLHTKDKRTAERQARVDAVELDRKIEDAERKLADFNSTTTKAAREQAKIARYCKQEAERRLAVIAPVSDTATPAASAIPSGGPYLEDILPKWAAERRVAAKTLDAHKAVARWFEAEAGHVALRSITRKQVLAFKDKMLADGVTVANAKLTRLRTLLNYAATNDFIPANPAKGITLIDPDAGKNERRSFDRGSLAAIFGSPIYAQDDRPKNGRGEAAYWLPLLGLYTGARLEELGQMRPQDVVLEPCVPDSELAHRIWNMGAVRFHRSVGAIFRMAGGQVVDIRGLQRRPWCPDNLHNNCRTRVHSALGAIEPPRLSGNASGGDPQTGDTSEIGFNTPDGGEGSRP